MLRVWVLKVQDLDPKPRFLGLWGFKVSVLLRQENLCHTQACLALHQVHLRFRVCRV